MSKNNLLSFLRNISMFAEMDNAELTQMTKDLKRKTFESGQTIFFQGDPGNNLYIIKSGTVRIYVHAKDGQEISVTIYGPGDLFGEMSLIDQQPRSATAIAVEDATMWTMSGADFYRHLQNSHQLALNIMLTLSARLRQTNESFMSLASLDVTRRVAKRLLSLALRQGEKTKEGIRITSPLTQGDLASLISASRESTNRVLRALQRKGLVDMQNRYIILLQPGKLSSLIGSDETWW